MILEIRTDLGEKLRAMKPMERRNYVEFSKKTCPCCGEKRNLTLFARETGNVETFLVNCRRCNKKLQEREVLKIVLGIMKSKDFY